METIHLRIFASILFIGLFIGLSGCMTERTLQFMPPEQVENVREDMEGYQQALATNYFAITPNEEGTIKSKIDGYEQGKLTIEDLNEKAGHEGNRELIGYYLLHPDEIQTKAKYPVSRSFSLVNAYAEAATLASAYLNVYSNDCRAWGDLGYDDTVLYALGDIEAADQIISCYDNAIRLGDTNSIEPLALSALVFNRMDIADRAVPRLLAMHKAGKLTNEDKPAVALILVTYSVTARREDIFIETINSEDLPELLRDEDLKTEIEIGCKTFKGKEMKGIRKKVKEAERQM